MRDVSITRTGWGGGGKGPLLESVERTRDTSCLQRTGKLLRILITKTQEGRPEYPDVEALRIGGLISKILTSIFF